MADFFEFEGDIILTPSSFTILINDTDYTDRMVSFRYDKILNELWPFSGEFHDITTADWTNFKQGAIIKFYKDGILLFKGEMEEPNFETDNMATVSGYQSGQMKLMKEKARSTASSTSYGTDDRFLYESISPTTIVAEQVNGIINIGVNDGGIGTITVRGENMNVLEFLTMGVVEASLRTLDNAYTFDMSVAGTYDLWCDEDSNEDDQVNFFIFKGSTTSTYTFNLGGSDQNAIGVSRKNIPPTNRVVALGYGDGINQLRSTFYSNSTILTVLRLDATASQTTLRLIDTVPFPASGEVIISEERITYTGKTADDLTGCTRGANGTTAVAHGRGSYCQIYHAPTQADSEAGTTMAVYGVQEKTFQYRDTIDQTVLDRQASRELIMGKDVGNYISIEVMEPDVVKTVRLGDMVTVNDTGTDLADDLRVIEEHYEISDQEKLVYTVGDVI